MKVDMEVIERIEELRTMRGWTINRLATEAMIPASSLASMYERNTPPKIETLKNLCDAFGITLAQFFSEGESYETVSKDEKLLLELYRSLSTQKQRALFTLLSE